MMHWTHCNQHLDTELAPPRPSLAERSAPSAGFHLLASSSGKNVSVSHELLLVYCRLLLLIIADSPFNYKLHSNCTQECILTEVQISHLEYFPTFAGGKCVQDLNVSGSNECINVAYKPDGAHLAVGDKVRGKSYFSLSVAQIGQLAGVLQPPSRRPTSLR
jgi:hypothetical protein